MDENPKSFGEFSAAVFASLDTSAYVPASVVVGLGWFLLEVGSTKHQSISAAMSKMAQTKFGGAVVALAAVFVVAALLQPFQFGLIRALEGYPLVRRARQRLVLRQHRRLLAADRVIRRGAQDEVRLSDRLDLLRSIDPDRLAEPFEAIRSAELQLRQRQLGEVLHEVDIAGRIAESMPDAERLLPLPLGNRLRAAEDAATDELAIADPDATIEAYIRANYDTLDTKVRIRLDRAKGRLEGYCTLTFCLVGLSVFALSTIGLNTTGAEMSATLIGASFVAHRAAIATADEYGQILITIAISASQAGDAEVVEADVVTIPESVSNGAQRADR